MIFLCSIDGILVLQCIKQWSFFISHNLFGKKAMILLVESMGQKKINLFALSPAIWEVEKTYIHLQSALVQLE